MLRAVRLHALQLELLKGAGLLRFEQSNSSYVYWTRNDHVESPSSNTDNLNLNHVDSRIVIDPNVDGDNIHNLFYSRIWIWSNRDDWLNPSGSYDSNQAQGF